MARTPTPKSVQKAASAKNAVVYLRVSSQEQEAEGYSTDAQERLIREYAVKHGYKIIKVFEDVETAKKAGRTEFDKMIRFIADQDGRCPNILAEKTDRVYRNIKDWVLIDDLGVSLHLVKEGKIISDEALSSDKFMHGIQVVMAKHYIDNLSEEVKKGMLEKARQGVYPSRAPAGYLNVVGSGRRKVIAIDPVLGPIVRKCFEQYATGSQSLEDVRSAAYKAGFRTKAGKPIGKSQIEQLLKNEFYVGSFFWLGYRFKGDHEPLISQELFDRVQAEKRRRGCHRSHVQERNHLYRGMMVCGRCGHTMTGEEQKGHIYYHCTGRSRSGCREPYAREDKVDAAVAEALQGLRFDEEVFEWLRSALTTSKDDERRYRQQQLDRLRQEVVKVQNRLDKVVDEKFDGILTNDDYQRLSNRYRKEIDEATAKIDAHVKADRSYVDLGVQLLELVQRAGSLYLRQTTAERRKLAAVVLSNCIWSDGKLVAKFRKPFDLLAVTKQKTAALAAVKEPERALCPVWLPHLDSNQEPTD
jgi:site-specific DNA recombinase